MWPKAYRDYKIDEPMIKETVEPLKGISGCEMHEINGWGNSIHLDKRKKQRGILASLFIYLFGESKDEVKKR